MSYFGSNIRKIRSIQKISQTEFAEIFDLSRASVGSYEEGRAEPKIDLINRVAKYFSITIDELINKELTVNELYHFDVGNEPTFKNSSKLVYELKSIPFCPAVHDIEKVLSDNEVEIDSMQMPLNEGSGVCVAVNITPRDFRAMPDSMTQNDIIIVDTEQVSITNDQYYVIKTGGAIYISKLKVLAGKTVLILQVDYDLLLVNIDDIDYYYPVIRYIGGFSGESESKRIDRLEEQLYRLTEKTIQNKL
ncbi:helix-turn-helix domain-containing protein [Carboxylicivirga sp. RSCT41]|uniref:helix-turn-helix domain-containing protein n=1 Tax=Carboxylicivirga agarovorans TaxID=3417570 RepID=UPI003D32BD27